MRVMRMRSSPVCAKKGSLMQTSKIVRAQASEDPASGQRFAGEVVTQPLTQPDAEVELLAVFFAAGARTRPHIHPNEQVLHFVEGRGVVATEHETTHTAAGDIVTVPAGIWHWHGAEPDAAATHISIKRPGPTNWDVDEKNWRTSYR